MRPQDIEKIANSVVSAFSKPSAASAGCGSMSNEDAFSCSPSFNCQPSGAYECGGAAAFVCSNIFAGDPECDTAFSCTCEFSKDIVG